MITKPVRIAVREDGSVEARSSLVGDVRDLPAIGTVVGPDSVIGRASTLGMITVLTLPSDAPVGRVSERVVGKRASIGAAYEEALFRYTTGSEQAADAREAVSDSGALVFRAPMAGRFYRKTSPDKPSLVEVGEVIETGRAVGLVEVMKTFHRLAYGGEGLPTRVKVVRALVEDGADIAKGDALFALELSE
jgi:acetyl-CoA carboxylase biotin carboxyl carrier protein